MSALPPELDAAAEEIRAAAKAAALPAEETEAALTRGDYFAVAEALVPRRGGLPAAVSGAVLGAVERALEIKTFCHPARFGEVFPITFGTSGHRGEIGHGLTLTHVHAIVAALIEQTESLSPAERAAEYGSADLEDVKARGFLIGHDNRLLNPEFSAYAAMLLSEAGYRVRYAGRLCSPEVSRVIPHLGWAGGINFTPSHNPFRYGGIKTSPADGGLSATELTGPLEELANRHLRALEPADWPAWSELRQRLRDVLAGTERVDVHGPYLACLAEHPVIRFDELCQALRTRAAGQTLHWVVDPVWGGAVPVYERIRERVGGETLTLLHTEHDPYFGGQTTEPNRETLQDAIGALRADAAPFQVAIRNDPDGDRGLVADAEGPIKTNQFAALVMRYLLDIGAGGDVATTLPTSHFGVDYARSRGQTVHVTPTGFKHFRPYLGAGNTMLAYEESDGLSIARHCLDKDGVLTGLLAVRMVLHYGRSLNDQLREVEAELGRYHWHQTTFKISIPAREAGQRLRQLARHAPGEELEADGRHYRLAEVNAEDGYKFLLEGGDWVMMRPSGTEPKVRVYAETRDSPAATRRLAALGERLAREAMGV